MTSEDELYDNIKKSMQYPMECVLCKKTTHQRGIFVPHESNRLLYGVKENSGILYPLCEDHQNITEEDATLVEKHILESIRKGMRYKNADEFVDAMEEYREGEDDPDES